MTKVKQNVTVFEYSHLGKGEKAAKSNRITQISESAFKYLKQLCLCDESESRFLSLKIIDSTEVLRLNNYAGVILTPDGTQIEVLPKIAKRLEGEVGEDKARQTLLTMLKTLGSFRHIQTSSANISKSKMPLLEVFITQFLDSVNTLVKRGLRSDYVKQQDNLGFLKGKLLVGKQLRHNSINKHKFYVEYDEFLQDRPVNRLVHSALQKVAKYTRSARNQKLLRELTFVFDEVPVSRNIKQDFAQVKLDRGMSYYQSPLAWAQLILDGFSPLTMKDTNSAFSLLFPMEAVFESYVESILKKQMADGFTLRGQVKQQYLVTHNTKNMFNLKPDLVVYKEQRVHVVLDTKWKLIDGSGKDKYGISQADMYQMFAYGHKYLAGKGNIVLIYPQHNGFKEAVEHSFDFNDELKLWVVPFVIEEGQERLLLPQGASFTSMISSINILTTRVKETHEHQINH
ncbi:McrC family protein [Moritella marina]|uniref:McrC family protein n=1 Tax=Moritella marina TaxID=90736 RepID=UPI001F0AEF88|nr:McrC family protein [Moritella marina]